MCREWFLGVRGILMVCEKLDETVADVLTHPEAI